MDQPASVDQQKRTIEWLNRLIMLARWHRKLPFHAVRLLNRPIEYQAFLARVRASATDKAQLIDTSAETTPVAVARKKLLEAVAAVPALQDLFGSDHDPFKGASADHIELLAEVSDVVADSQNMVYTRNATLPAVMVAMRQGSELDPDSLIFEDVKKFFTLIETEPPAEKEKSTAELLYDLAVSPHWYIVMASLRADRDYTLDEEAGDSLKDALKLWREKIAKPSVHQLLLKPGHLARAPKKLICLLWEHRDLFAEARAKIPENKREKNPDDERKQVADAAFLLFEEKFKTHLDAIRADLQVLAMVGTHFINVRKFAKLDGFDYNWRQIAQLGRANYKALKHVEQLVLNRAPRPTDEDLEAQGARVLYSLIEKNERLKDFMRLRPHFSEINENELMQFRPLASVTLTGSSARAEAAVRESVDVPPQPQPQPQPQPPSPPPPAKGLQVQTLSIKRTEAPASDKGLTYNVSFAKDVTGQVTFDVQKLLERILSAMGVSSDSGLQEILKELFVSDPRFAEERIRRGSVELLRNALPATIQLFPETLDTLPSLRLVINSSDNEVHYLPWEWWPTSASTLLLSGPDNSVVRGFSWPDQVSLPGPIFPPLRLMSIIPNAPSGRRFTSDMTLRSLDELKTANNVQYLPLIREEATVENFKRQLEVFKPHVVHFEGYLEIGQADDLYVILSGSTSEGEGWIVKKFGSELRTKGVQLLVIGRNNVSRVYENACATAAFALAQEGLTLIAPLRAIDDSSATTFTTEFYRAFLQGTKLEQALHLARRDLAAKGGDWTVFALFGDPNRLDHFELVRESA
jgi:hypothetical protein